MRQRMLARLTVGFLTFLLAASAPGGEKPSTRAAANIVQAISRVSGTYQWRTDLGRYEYSEKIRLEELISRAPAEQIAAVLIGCLDAESATASTIDGKPVPLGIVCYEALTQLVYYEPAEPGGDLATHWFGYISPRASPEDMRKAKSAWKKAADERQLVFQ